ncbi:probable glutamate receptor isoform X1 [Penaeus vannamei]|uniref:probable glutamate receptor isoform X1 n=1 Tax=Penaeus vannamei TaxID=6689 RepID=UPI00387F8F02
MATTRPFAFAILFLSSPLLGVLASAATAGEAEGLGSGFSKESVVSFVASRVRRSQESLRATSTGPQDPPGINEARWKQAVKQAVEENLSECAISIFADHDFGFSLATLFPSNPVKVFTLEEEVLTSRSTWSRALCDAYIFVVGEGDALLRHADVSHYHDHDPHSHDPHPYWNYRAFHLVLLLGEGEGALLPSEVAGLYNFRKTENLLVLQRGRGGDILAWTHLPFSRGAVRVFLVDTWRRGRFLKGRDLFPEKLDNLQGFPLRVATFEHPPSVVYQHDEDDPRKVLDRLGVDMQIVQTLAGARNFSLEFTEVSHDELWGYELPNGTWLGLVGQVFYEKADVGACNMFLDLHRWRQVDYSVPYNFERGCFVAPAPKPLVNWQAPLLPFSGLTWASIAVALALCGGLLYAVVALSSQAELPEFRSVVHDYLYMAAAFTMRAPHIRPSQPPVRVYVGFVWLFCLILATAYSANLVAFLSSNQMSAPVDTLEQLSRSGLRIGGHAFWKTQFSASIDPLVRDFSNVLESDVELSSLFDRVEGGEFALIENKQYLELQAGARFTYGSRTTIRIVPECLLPYSIGLAFQKNSPLKRNFDGVILRLFESGVLQKWKEEVVTFYRRQYSGRKLDDEFANTRVRPLELTQLQGVFFVLGLGYVAAALALAGEAVVSLYTPSP